MNPNLSLFASHKGGGVISGKSLPDSSEESSVYSYAIKHGDKRITIQQMEKMMGSGPQSQVRKA